MSRLGASKGLFSISCIPFSLTKAGFFSLKLDMCRPDSTKKDNNKRLSHGSVRLKDSEIRDEMQEYFELGGSPGQRGRNQHDADNGPSGPPRRKYYNSRSRSPKRSIRRSPSRSPRHSPRYSPRQDRYARQPSHSKRRWDRSRSRSPSPYKRRDSTYYRNFKDREEGRDRYRDRYRDRDWDRHRDNDWDRRRHRRDRDSKLNSDSYRDGRRRSESHSPFDSSFKKSTDGASGADLQGTLPPPPPPEVFPRSPDISKHLIDLANSQDLKFNPESGIEDAGLLNVRLSQMESILLGHNLGSWAEQEEQCRLLALQYGLCGKEEDDKEPFSGQAFSSYFADSGTPPGQEIPYSQAGTVNDPRLQFEKEYEMMKAWAAKPRLLPGFAIEKNINTGQVHSPTHSWSKSPQRPDPFSRKDAAKVACKGDITKEENCSAPRISSLPRVHSQEKSMDQEEKQEEMELEEGYFCLKHVDGSDFVLQYGQIVDMIKEGKLPNKWPAYRESDALWVSVSADEEAEAPKKKDAADLEATKQGSPFWKSSEDTAEVRKWFEKQGPVVAKALVGKPAPLVLQYPRLMSTSKKLFPGPREFDLEKEAEIAERNLADFKKLANTRRLSKTLCGAPKDDLPASKLAMIKGCILLDRHKVKDLATGALQKALKSFLEMQASGK